MATTQQTRVNSPTKSSIYDYDKRISRTMILIQKETSPKNQEIIQRYDDLMLCASMAKATRHKHLQTILNLTRYLKKDWDVVTSNDIGNLVVEIVRTGQVKDIVRIHHIKASIGGYGYDEMKLNRLKFKRTLADCAVDGLLPEKNLVSAAQASKEAIRWLARLERGEISCVSRRDLNRILLPVEIKKRQSKYGDFSKQNQKINTEKSSTTHQRMLKNPEEWHEYHRNYREERETWKVIPFNEWIKRIKKLSDRFLIGDFGCGEAKIAETIGSRVINFDHVAIDSHVISCDMSDVSEHVKNGGLDVALFSLSLMSKNWQDYLKEASRCLNENGYLFIAETTKSLSRRLDTLRDEIKNQGFEIYKDDEIGLFTFIEARKIETSE